MSTQPKPELIFGMMTAYQQSAALKAAVEIDLFSAIGEGVGTAAALAGRCHASERGVRILADFFCVHGLLTKHEGRYGLSPDAALFLDRKSPAYLGGMTGFLGAKNIRAQFDTLTEAVRKGGVVDTAEGATADEYEGWVDFAQSMEAMMGPATQQIAAMVNGGKSEPIEVLDVAASHGMFGFTIAKQNAAAKITALDWENVLAVTRANAKRLGLSDRVTTIAGDAFAVDLAGPYDVILLTNLLHHFDHAANVRLLKRMKAALKPGGRVITLEPVPNEDRISPPMPATFSLIMLASTPGGDAYTFAEFERMFAEAGFASSSLVPLQMAPQSVIVSV